MTLARLRLVALATLLSLLLTPASGVAHAASCTNLLSRPGAALTKLWARLVVPRSMREFDLEAYRHARKEYELAGDSLGEAMLLPVTIEERLAFIEATARLEPIYMADSKLRQRKLARVLKKVDFLEGVSSIQAAAIVEELYLISRGDPYSIKDFAKRGSEANLKEIFQRLVEEQVSSRGLEQAIIDLGLARPATRLERVKDFVARDPVKVATTLALNLAISQVAYGMRLAPSIRPFTWIKLPDAIVDKVMKEGIDAAWPEISRRYGRFLKADRGYNLIRTAYNRIASVVLVFVMGRAIVVADESDDDSEKVAGAVTDALIESLKSETALMEQEAGVDGRALRHELLEDWKDQHRQKHGAEPDPSSGDFKAVLKLLR